MEIFSRGFLIQILCQVNLIALHVQLEFTVQLLAALHLHRLASLVSTRAVRSSSSPIATDGAVQWRARSAVTKWPNREFCRSVIILSYKPGIGTGRMSTLRTATTTTKTCGTGTRIARWASAECHVK
jgi:hypothetical protein